MQTPSHQISISASIQYPRQNPGQESEMEGVWLVTHGVPQGSLALYNTPALAFWRPYLEEMSLDNRKGVRKLRFGEVGFIPL